MLLRNEHLHNLYPLSDIGMLRSRRLRLAGTGNIRRGMTFMSIVK
jgi:hypothetical protein